VLLASPERGRCRSRHVRAVERCLRSAAMSTAPTPPKPADEPEDPATKEPGEGSTKKKSKASWFTFRRTMVVGGALSIGWGAGVLVGRWLGWWDEGASGTFGDSFAPLLGLLTVAALAAALDSVRMQREELQLQRRELELTREEMKAQRLATEAQAAEVKRANELQARAQLLAAVGLLHEVEKEAVEAGRDAHWAMEARGKLAREDDPHAFLEVDDAPRGRALLKARRRRVLAIVRELEELQPK